MVGTKAQPTFTVGFTDEENTDAQDREWENAKKNDGFYRLGETPTLLPREIRGVVKALKEMEEEDQLLRG